MTYAFGVSPAYYISLFGTRFTIEDVCNSLPLLSRLGFNGYQTEVYYEENLFEWEKGAACLQLTGSKLGLKSSQFVAHFMLHYFAGDGLFSNKGLTEIESVIRITKQFDECSQITVPVGPYAGINNLSLQERSDLKKRVIDKLFVILQKIERENLKMALEILPGALITVGEDFNSICDQFGSPNIGLNLDSGHANAAKEDVQNLPLQCEGRIFGTHLCDNYATENLSLKPGTGSIQWGPLIHNLVVTEYKGWMDIEILCKQELVESEYAAAKSFLERLLNKENVA